MSLDLRLYRAVIPGLKNIIASHQSSKKSEIASIAAIATNAPIVVCCYYIGFITGFDDELNSTINNLVSFYRYDKIEGIDEFSKEYAGTIGL